MKVFTGTPHSSLLYRCSMKFLVTAGLGLWKFSFRINSGSVLDNQTCSPRLSSPSVPITALIKHNDIVHYQEIK